MTNQEANIILIKDKEIWIPPSVSECQSRDCVNARKLGEEIMATLRAKLAEAEREKEALAMLLQNFTTVARRINQRGGCGFDVHAWLDQLIADSEGSDTLADVLAIHARALARAKREALEVFRVSRRDPAREGEVMGDGMQDRLYTVDQHRAEMEAMSEENIKLHTKLAEARNIIERFYKYIEPLNHVHLPPYGKEGNILYASEVYDILEKLKGTEK